MPLSLEVWVTHTSRDIGMRKPRRLDSILRALS
jgi:hypothetical protein